MPEQHHKSCQHAAYRLTCQDFEDIWEHAGGRCEICRVEPGAGRYEGLVIDHAGEYGYFAVRGLLCRKCNRMMGEADQGRITDERAYRYWENAWFVRLLKARHAANLTRRPGAKALKRPDAGPWSDPANDKPAQEHAPPAE